MPAAKKTDTNYTLVNSTGVDIRFAEREISACVRNGTPLPEEVSDIFVLTIRHDLNADGSPRGILTMA